MDAPPTPERGPSEPPEPAARTTLAVLLATGLGASRGVPAPGTVGAVWGIPIWLAVAQLPAYGWQLAAVAALVALGVPICSRAAADLGGGKDPQEITWDEFATVPIVYACAPQACSCASWLLIGFALHRLFDISKPPPCRWLERLPGGWGIMMDDVAAALYAGAVYSVAWHHAGGV